MGGGGGGDYGFLFRSEFFFRTTRELEYLFFLSGKARNFFQDLHIRLYDKHSESDYFFSSNKIRIFFSATLGIRIFFLEKYHNTPLQVKWSFPYLSGIFSKLCSNSLWFQSIPLSKYPYNLG